MNDMLTYYNTGKHYSEKVIEYMKKLYRRAEIRRGILNVFPSGRQAAQ